MTHRFMLTACGVACLTLTLTAAGSVPSGKPEDVGMSNERLTRIHDAVQRPLDSGALPGAVTLVAHLLRVPTSTVIGTSMVLTLVTMVFATMLHAMTNHLVDAVLALILMVGGVTGAQFGARAGQKIRGEHLRLLLGVLVLAVGIRFAIELVIRPEDLFTVRETGGAS